MSMSIVPVVVPAEEPIGEGIARQHHTHSIMSAVPSAEAEAIAQLHHTTSVVVPIAEEPIAEDDNTPTHAIADQTHGQAEGQIALVHFALVQRQIEHLKHTLTALREGKEKEDADGGGGGEPATVAKLNRFATRAATVAIGLIWVALVIEIVFGYSITDITLPVIAGLLLMSFVATFPDTADAAHWCWGAGAWRVVLPARIHRTRGKIVGAAVGSYTIFLTLDRTIISRKALEGDRLAIFIVVMIALALVAPLLICHLLEALAEAIYHNYAIINDDNHNSKNNNRGDPVLRLVASKMVSQFATVTVLVLYLSFTGTAAGELERREYTKVYCELAEGATPTSETTDAWNVRPWHFDNCTVEEVLPDAAAMKSATPVQLQQQLAYERQQAALSTVGKSAYECYELLLLAMTLQIILFVCKLRTKDVLEWNFSGCEKVLAVCTVLRVLFVAFIDPLQGISSSAFRLPWLSLVLVSIACMVWLVRRAKSGDDVIARRYSRSVCDDD